MKKYSNTSLVSKNFPALAEYEKTDNQPIVFKFSGLKNIPKQNLFIYTNKDFYKKIFFQNFSDFKSFKDQLADLNDAENTYTYTGSMLKDENGNDIDSFDFRHLLFEYFFRKRNLNSIDKDIELGVGLYVEEEAAANSLPDSTALQWIPFNDPVKMKAPTYNDDLSIKFAGKDTRVSLKTYPSYLRYYQTGDVEFNKKWLKYFKVNDEAMEFIDDISVSSTVPITDIKMYLCDVTQPFAIEVESCIYPTTTMVESTITNYSEVRSQADPKRNDFSEINFDETSWIDDAQGRALTVESVWQRQTIDGRTIIAICPSNDERNIIHERHANGELYAINIPSDNIFRGSAEDFSTIESLTINLKRNVLVTGELNQPSCLRNQGGTEWSSDKSPVEYCSEHIITDLNQYLKELETDSERTAFVIEKLLGKLFVCGRTDMRAKPFDPVRYGSSYPWSSVDDDGYVALDEIGADLQRRIANYISSNAVPGNEDMTYPWKDENGVVRYSLFSKLEIETNWYAGIVSNVEVKLDEYNDYQLILQLTSVTKSELKKKASPMGWVFGESQIVDSNGVKVYYEPTLDGTKGPFGEALSISKYMTSFRFFDLSVMRNHTPISGTDSDLDPRRKFTPQDTAGAFCPTLNKAFYYNYETFRTLTDNLIKSSVTISPGTDLAFWFTDWQVYFGSLMGQGLWQKGLEVIIDASFEDLPGFKDLFTSETNFTNEYSFISHQRLLSEFNFTNSTLPVSVVSDTYYNSMNNRDVDEIEVEDINLMGFIPLDFNQEREKYFLQEQMTTYLGKNAWISDVKDLPTISIGYPALLLYQEDLRDDDYVKDFYDEEFSNTISRYSITGENTSGQEISWLYCYRPVRHSIKFYTTSFTDGTYLFDFNYVWLNKIDETEKNIYREMEAIEEAVIDPFQYEKLLSRKQPFGTYYYELTSNGVEIILPTHDLYPKTVLDPNAEIPTPPVFFKPGSKVCVGVKLEKNNVDSVELQFAKAQDIANGKTKWNSEFREVTDEVELSPVTAELKAPYGELWISLTKNTLVNHNFIHPAEWELELGMVVDKKMWKERVETTYIFSKPTIAHFYITEDSEIKYFLTSSTIDNIRKQFNRNVAYIGSAIIPPTAFFGLNKNIVNLNADEEAVFNDMKNLQLVEIEAQKIQLNNKQDENNREGLDGYLYNGIAHYTQMVKIVCQNDNDRFILQNLQSGNKVYQNDVAIGEVITVYANLDTIAIMLYDSAKPINTSANLVFDIFVTSLI